MLCVLKILKTKQLKLFIDSKNLQVLAYGSNEVIESYFENSSINLKISETEIQNSGWDYLILDEENMYFIVNINYRIKDRDIGFFYYDDEISGIGELCSRLKERIRNEMIENIIN